MIAIEYYHKLKQLYHKEVSKSEFIYIYTTTEPTPGVGTEYIVTQVMFKTRKGKYITKTDAPHDKLLLSRDKKLPVEVIVQVKFSPLVFNLLEG